MSDNDIDRVYRIETGTSIKIVINHEISGYPRNSEKFGAKFTLDGHGVMVEIQPASATSPPATWALKHMALKNGDTSALVIFMFMAILALLLKKICSTIKYGCFPKIVKYPHIHSASLLESKLMFRNRQAYLREVGAIGRGPHLSPYSEIQNSVATPLADCWYSCLAMDMILNNAIQTIGSQPWWYHVIFVVFWLYQTSSNQPDWAPPPSQGRCDLGDLDLCPCNSQLLAGWVSSAELCGSLLTRCWFRLNVDVDENEVEVEVDHGDGDDGDGDDDDDDDDGDGDDDDDDDDDNSGDDYGDGDDDGDGGCGGGDDDDDDGGDDYGDGDDDGDKIILIVYIIF